MRMPMCCWPDEESDTHTHTPESCRWAAMALTEFAFGSNITTSNPLPTYISDWPKTVVYIEIGDTAGGLNSCDNGTRCTSEKHATCHRQQSADLNVILRDDWWWGEQPVKCTASNCRIPFCGGKGVWKELQKLLRNDLRRFLVVL
jgi:hypothetical protein